MIHGESSHEGKFYAMAIEAKISIRHLDSKRNKIGPKKG